MVELVGPTRLKTLIAAPKARLVERRARFVVDDTVRIDFAPGQSRTRTRSTTRKPA
jgi:hypothetical protein